ncbi:MULTISPECIES: DotA/TraY family protein [Xanthomonas]|nr:MULTISPECIES: DotA/TraY family protein [Xanthomonas]MBV6747228.1 DotA/TraY family protein [Xanthomonas vasicola pv. vasculorum NCPPB 890]MBV6892702.1 DotA/TraY family protein [Xanthomonas vasicola pv. vasculorum]MDO6948373.1 DotA/TraY family protein [Xanthomonas vasicola]MDO6960452.1 DotA/TraY family protein [Xanthomonas vasicola]HHZ28484.1 DotA/TraY family protein [Xanthomonas vasicola pv. zeae]
MLRHIFGGVIDRLVAGADPDTVTAATSILGSMFSVFNSGVLVVGTMIVSYVAVVGVINTANDGEAMGRNWSSLWTPVRIVAGGASLLPTASGFSFIQLFAFMLALWGVGLANTVYDKGVALGILSPNGLVASVNDPGKYYGLREFARQYVAASYCARSANALYADPNSGTSPQVQAGTNADQIFDTSGRREYLFNIADRNPSTNLAGGQPVCGTVKIAEYAPQTKDDPTEQAMEQVRYQAQEQKKAAAVQMMAALDQWVNSWPTSISEAGWDSVYSNRFNEIVSQYEQQVATGLANGLNNSQNQLAVGMSAYVNSLTADGWANAGGWFQRVGLVRTQLSNILSEQVGQVGAPSMTGLPNDARSSLLASSVSIVSDITKKAEEKSGYTSDDVKPEDIASAIPSDPMAAVNVGQMRADMDAKTSSWINRRMKDIVDIAIGADSNGTVPSVTSPVAIPGVTDPNGTVGRLCGTAGEIGGSLNRMKCIGDYLTVTLAAAKMIDVTVKTSLTVLRVAAGTLSSVKGVGNGLDLDKIVTPIWDWVMEVPLKQLAMLATYLEPLAFYFGVFLPSLPYTIFMVVVCGWVLAVLQTAIAAPLWAVMHMTPDRTFVGSQRQGYLLLMSLFARPALAVIGLFAGVLVSDPLIDYTARAFFSMRGAVATSTGTVGAISEFLTFAWWLIVFGFTLLPILYMSFGLPQVLPDKVLQWIGAGVSDLGETGALSHMRGAGAATTAQMGRVAGRNARLGGPGGGGGRLPPGGGGGGGGGGPPPGGPPLSGGPQGVAPRSAPVQSLPRLSGPTGGPRPGDGRLAPIGPMPGAGGQGVTPRTVIDGRSSRVGPGRPPLPRG